MANSWDWGPTLITHGVWRAAYVEASLGRITDFYPVAEVHEDLSATFSFSYEAEGSDSATIELVDPHGAKVFSSGAAYRSGETYKVGDIDSPQLWWPSGLGEQPLYNATLRLHDADGDLLDTRTVRIGFRRLRVLESPLLDADNVSRSFTFEINNFPTWISGLNVIPIDSFLTRPSNHERREKMLASAVDLGANMIRIWAGGVVLEDEQLYDLADQRGLLLWQEMGFGCQIGPAFPDDFVKSVENEATAIVRATRHRPSLAIISGNNEDYSKAQGLVPVTGAINDSMPARMFYEELLPSVVARETSVELPVKYVRGSPYGRAEDPYDTRVGDAHLWQIWGGNPQRSWRDYKQFTSRFTSEFGFLSFPDARTVDYWLGANTSERFPSSVTNAAQCVRLAERSHVRSVKAYDWAARLALYVANNFNVPMHRMDDYIYATQLLQSEAMSSAYSQMRRNFKGPGREYTSGAMLWQLNDVWPVASWSLVDYLGHTKPAYHSVKRTIAPVTVGLNRNSTSFFPIAASVASITNWTLEAFAFNSRREDRHLRFVLKSCELMTGKIDILHKSDVVLRAGYSTEIGNWTVPASDPFRPVVYQARLLDSASKVISETIDWPYPLNSLHWPSTTLSVKIEPKRIKVKADRAVKGLIFSIKRGDGWLDDNAIDLWPGEEQIITGGGLKASEIEWRHLGQFAL